VLGKRYKLLYVVSSSSGCTVRGYCVIEETREFVTCGYDWLSLWKTQPGNYLQVRHIGILHYANTVALFYKILKFANNCNYYFYCCTVHF